MDQDEPADEPRRWLDEVERLRRRARQLRQGFWFPLVAFGLVLVAAAPVYANANALVDRAELIAVFNHPGAIGATPDEGSAMLTCRLGGGRVCHVSGSA